VVSDEIFLTIRFLAVPHTQPCPQYNTALHITL